MPDMAHMACSTTDQPEAPRTWPCAIDQGCGIKKSSLANLWYKRLGLGADFDACALAVALSVPLCRPVITLLLYKRLTRLLFLIPTPLINGTGPCSRSLWLACGGTSHMCHFWHVLHHASDGAEAKSSVSGFWMFWLLPQAKVVGGEHVLKACGFCVSVAMPKFSRR